MKKVIFGLAFLFFLPDLLFATHYMGGEITWECMSGPSYTVSQQGRYRFNLKLYRECYTAGGGSAATFGGTESILTNVPGFATISMTLKSGWPKDISPRCFTDSLSVKCIGMNGANANMGAMQEYYYTSDGAYPNGIQFNGVPPATGWIFKNYSCCRNPATNVTNANNFGWTLRAIMYPYNGQNAYPCFDNSPTFAESPISVMCTQFPIVYNYNAIDKDDDSLLFEWGIPLTDGGGNLAFAPGYAYDNPLPNLIQNPSNVPATMNPATGEITLKPITTGAFVTSTKVSTFKNGIKTAEIWRDVQLNLQNCQNSIAPVIYFSNNYQAQEIGRDIHIGDSLELSIFSSDTGQIPRLAFWAVGSEFGSFTSGNPGNYSDVGCLKPPCASLSNAGVKYNPSYINPNISVFKWKTSSNHIPAGKNSEAYYFYFYASNLACPVPIISYAKLKVVVWNSMQSVETPLNINKLILEQNRPNPTNGKTEFNFTLPLNGEVVFELKNVLGQVVFSSKEKYQIGKNSISLDLSTYSPGLYFYSINMLGNTQTKKMVIK